MYKVEFSAADLTRPEMTCALFLAALQRHRGDGDLVCSAHRGLCALCARWVALLQDSDIAGLFSAALGRPGGAVATAVVAELLALLRTPRDEPCCDSALTAAGAVVQQNLRVLLARAL